MCHLPGLVDKQTANPSPICSSWPLSQADINCSEALRIDPGHKVALQMRSDIKSEKTQPDIRRHKLGAAGYAAFNSGKFDDAIRLYSEAIALDFSRTDLLPTLYTNRATAHFRKGEYNAAVTDCDAALQLNSQHVKAMTRRAACRMELTQWAQAVKDYETALRIEPSDPFIKEELRKAKFELEKQNTPKLYLLLGVPKSASPSEIKAAFKRLAKMLHSDRRPASCSATEGAKADERFKDVNQAYEILKDPDKRKDYDGGADVKAINTKWAKRQQQQRH